MSWIILEKRIKSLSPQENITNIICVVKSNQITGILWQDGGVPMANVAKVKKYKENIYIIEPDGTRYTLSKEANEILKVY